MATEIVTRKYRGANETRMALHGVYWSETGSRKEPRTLFVDVAPLHDEPCVVEKITSELRLHMKKPFLKLFGGTKEIVFAGLNESCLTDPLMHLELILEIIHTLRAQGYLGKLSLETNCEDINKVHASWSKVVGRAVLYTGTMYPYGGHLEVDDPMGIVRRLKLVGLDEIQILVNAGVEDKTGPSARGDVWQFVYSCPRAGLETVFRFGIDWEYIERKTRMENSSRSWITPYWKSREVVISRLVDECREYLTRYMKLDGLIKFRVNRDHIKIEEDFGHSVAPSSSTQQSARDIPWLNSC